MHEKLIKLAIELARKQRPKEAKYYKKINDKDLYLLAQGMHFGLMMSGLIKDPIRISAFMLKEKAEILKAWEKV